MTVDAVAHIAGVPLEEAVVPVLSGIGTGLLVVRAWLTSRVRRRDRDAPTAPARHTGARSAASFVRGRGAEIVEEAEPTAEELAERLGCDRTGRAEWRPRWDRGRPVECYADGNGTGPPASHVALPMPPCP